MLLGHLGARNCCRLAFIWAHLAVAARPGVSLTTSCGLREEALLCAICGPGCPKESGALTVIQRPCVFSYHRAGAVHMTTAEAAALRRADIFCGGRPDVDVVAAQMLLEYQDKCARIHMCTRPQTFKAVPGQWLRVMLLSAIIGLTLKMLFFPLCQACVNPRPLWPTAMETLELTAFGSAGRRAAACLRVGVLTEKLLGLSTGCDWSLSGHSSKLDCSASCSAASVTGLRKGTCYIAVAPRSICSC